MQQHHEYKISGVSVLFPCKPYPSQFSMMDKIIKGIERRQNCLIESPTGSGKSLALLCSTLAWQLAERAKQELADSEELEKPACTCSHGKNDVSPPKAPSSETAPEKMLVDLSSKKLTTGLPDSDFAHSDDDDFKSVGSSLKQPPKTKDRKKHVSIAYESDHELDSPVANRKVDDAVSCGQKNGQNDFPVTVCTCDASKSERKPRIKIPKIYFGTRTHKQVAQIVRELRKTSYQEVKMTVLGSREHTCIHPQVSKMKNKTEACRELLNGEGCHFKDCTLRLTSQHTVKSQGLSTAWDLEDMVHFCKAKRACAYFLSRGLKDESDLIICPYNYLVDPMVREAMKICLKGHVVILDEAHNIEDSAREAASQSLTQESIHKAVKDIESLMEANINLADHSKLRSVLKNLDTFIDTNKTKLEQKDWDKSYKVWTGYQLVAQLEDMGLGPKLYPEYKKALASVRADAEQKREESTKSRQEQDALEMKPLTLTILEQVFQVLDYLYRFDLKYVDDYRASLFQSQSYVPGTYDGQWLNSKSANGGRMNMQVDTYTLNFWCMNPGVAFSDFSETRSIILTSGTLSPLTSFESELGLEFKIQLEANHVIEDSQVWVGTLGQGPSGSTLQAVFRNLETFTFQDELGNLVLGVCKVVPHGVLCFLPSYNVLDKLMNRWQSTGLKRQLEQLKLVIREPKNSDKLNFDDQLKMFYEAMTPQPEDSVDKTGTEGAVFFAVCRGKVSEGLDFADDYARAVITVGVPYPNFKDVQVELKRKYNDQHHQARGLLPGHEWYEVQAFRALNQALGRCIRHRHDWGALIIVDDRFVKTSSKYCKGLSKWVRTKIQTFRDFGVAMESLSKFTTGQLALRDKPGSSMDTSFDKCFRTPQRETSTASCTVGQDPVSPNVLKPHQVFSIFTSSNSFRITPKTNNSRNKPVESRNNRRGPSLENNSPSQSLVPQLLAGVRQVSQSNTRPVLESQATRPPYSPYPANHNSNASVNNGLQTAADNSITDRNSNASVNNGLQTAADSSITRNSNSNVSVNNGLQTAADNSITANRNSNASVTNRLQTAADSSITRNSNASGNTCDRSQTSANLNLKPAFNLSDSALLSKHSSSIDCGTERSVPTRDLTRSFIHVQDSVTGNANQIQLTATGVDKRQRHSTTEFDPRPSATHNNHSTTRFSGGLYFSAGSPHHVGDGSGGDGSVIQSPDLFQTSAQLHDECSPSAADLKNNPFCARMTTPSRDYSEKYVKNHEEMDIAPHCIPLTTQIISSDVNSHQRSDPTDSPFISTDIKPTCFPLSENLSPARHASPPVEDSACTSVKQTYSTKRFLFKSTPLKGREIPTAEVVDTPTKGRETYKTVDTPLKGRDTFKTTEAVDTPLKGRHTFRTTEAVNTPLKGGDTFKKTETVDTPLKGRHTFKTTEAVDMPLKGRHTFKTTEAVDTPLKGRHTFKTTEAVDTPLKGRHTFKTTEAVDTPLKGRDTFKTTEAVDTPLKGRDTFKTTEAVDTPLKGRGTFKTTEAVDTPLKGRRTPKIAEVDISTTDTKCSPKSSLPWGLSLGRKHASPSAVPEDGSQDSEEKLVVRRKVRGTKRKHLSRSSGEGRQKEEQGTSCRRESTGNIFTCSACGHVLADSVQETEFQEQRSVPSFLRDIARMDHSGCLFFPGQTDWEGLQGLTDCKTGGATKYVEQEDICVQFLYCSQCLGESTLTPPAVGAKVKLAAGSGARFSRGQVWLFLSVVSQTTKR